MDYCSKIHYTIECAAPANFETMVGELLERLPQDEVVLRLVFFGAMKADDEYVKSMALLKEKVYARYGDKMPALSLVGQAPLSAPLLLEAHCYMSEPGDIFHFRSYRDLSYVLLENETGRFLFAGGLQGNVMNASIERQSQEAFSLLCGLLASEKFSLTQIIRQWNYIERITGVDGIDQRYQSFNNVRSACYACEKWDNGYPAATGIGSAAGGVLIDVDAVSPISPDAYITPIDNRLQIAAHAYSGLVLEVSHQKKTTPKFERAKSITTGDMRLVYVSGTAAIRGEKSLRGVGLECQLRTTMENIYELIGGAQLAMLRVYLKRQEDYAEAKFLLDSYKLGIPISFLSADVCREELLIEIEGIAKGEFDQ